MAKLRVIHLGRVEYEDGLALLKVYGEARKHDLVPDTLLLLEHPPVLTLGRAAKRANILASDEALASEGVEVFETNRGGDVTYHGPGQLVGYPILRLLPGRQDVRRYVRDLEETLIRVCARYGVSAGRIPKWTGVWVGSEDDPAAAKIAAIGVHISRWQTSHGFALNVNTRLEHFGLIVPCGISEAGVTSLARQTGRTLSFDEVAKNAAASFCEVFDAQPEDERPTLRTIVAVVTRKQGAGQQVLLLKRTPDRGGFWQPVTGRVDAEEDTGEAAAREILEETGQALKVEDLHYRHSFCWGEELPPRLLEESAFAARWSGPSEVRIDPREHDGFEWVSPEEAARRLPFVGLRRAVRLACGQKA